MTTVRAAVTRFTFTAGSAGIRTALTADQILLPYIWRRYLRILRLLVSLACLGTVFVNPSAWPPWAIAALVLLLLFAVAALFWKEPDEAAIARIALGLDTLFFLVAVAYQDSRGFWLGAAFAFYLILSATLLHGAAEVAFVSGVSLLYLALAHGAVAGALRPVVAVLGAFACILSWQKRSLLDKLSHLSSQVVMFRSEAENARESERGRIAADFHDGPLQSFISFQLRLEIVRKKMTRDPASGLAELAQLQDLCRSQVSELRAFVRSMRPVESGRAGLLASLTRIAQAFQRESGIPVSLPDNDGAELDDVEAGTELLQVIREALHNVQKHSAASRVMITVQRRDAFLEFCIQDDGKGFPFSGTFTLEELDTLRLGPASIKLRVRSLNGDLTLESKPGAGSRLQIRVPV